MEKIDWKVDGMTCSNCALSVTKYLKNEGMQDVKVNPISGAVSFTSNETDVLPKLKTGIKSLGYKVVNESENESQGHHHSHESNSSFLGSSKKKFLFCLPFTLVLMLHMLDKWWHIHWLMNPWIQLALCLPVFITGMVAFGKSAYKSVTIGVPNMDVLITIGAIASFVYSLTGAILNLGHDYLFFETTASIITLVLMGNYLEETTIQSTQKAVKSLAKSQKVMANMIAFDSEHKEQVFQVENSALRTGDLVLIKAGEQVPADCKILWGEGTVNEAILTGESLPESRQKKDLLIGGSLLETGTVKAQVTASGKDTVMAGIVRMMEDAQAEKPPMQKLADKISAVFVPLILGIAVLTFLVNFFTFDKTAGVALMRSVAVLVISCPCAMGLATPAAIAVGLGRAAKNGMLFKNASALETFKTIKQIVFDKTGTLTTGNFVIAGFKSEVDDGQFKTLLYALEKYSNHPLGKSIAAQWKTNEEIKWKSVEEIKGLGIKATDAEGYIYQAGSFNILPKNFTDTSHNIFVTKNDAFIGWIDLEDEIRPEAATVINWLKQKQLKTILLSGDRKEKSEALNRKNGVVHNCRIFYEEPVLTASIDTGSAGTRIIKQILKSLKKIRGIEKVEVDF